jgi:hypothetical protein
MTYYTLIESCISPPTTFPVEGGVILYYQTFNRVLNKYKWCWRCTLQLLFSLLYFLPLTRTHTRRTLENSQKHTNAYTKEAQKALMRLFLGSHKPT